MAETVKIDLRHVARGLAKISLAQVQAVVELLDEGNTVPFITRYRKDRTGGLDEEAVRHIQVNLAKMRALNERKNQILRSLETHGRLAPELTEQIAAAGTTKRLEDLYLPYRPKKTTLATAAKTRGLEPLAGEILRGADSCAELDSRATEYTNAEEGVAHAADALLGAGHIIAEWFSENVELRQKLRNLLSRTAKITAAPASEDMVPQAAEKKSDKEARKETGKESGKESGKEPHKEPDKEQAGELSKEQGKTPSAGQEIAERAKPVTEAVPEIPKVAKAEGPASAEPQTEPVAPPVAGEDAGEKASAESTPQEVADAPSGEVPEVVDQDAPAELKPEAANQETSAEPEPETDQDASAGPKPEGDAGPSESGPSELGSADGLPSEPRAGDGDARELHPDETKPAEGSTAETQAEPVSGPPEPDKHEAPKNEPPSPGEATAETAADRNAATNETPAPEEASGAAPSAPVPSAPVPSAPVPSAPVPSAPVPSAPVPSAPVPSAPVPSDAVSDVVPRPEDTVEDGVSTEALSDANVPSSTSGVSPEKSPESAPSPEGAPVAGEVPAESAQPAERATPAEIPTESPSEAETKETKPAASEAAALKTVHAAQKPKRKKSSKAKAQAQRLSKSQVRKQRARDKRVKAFSDYFNFSEEVGKIPPHRVLALNRGERAKILRVHFEYDTAAFEEVVNSVVIPENHPHREFLKGCAKDALTRLLLPSLERELRRELTEKAEEHAVKVFALNLRNLLLQPPVHQRRVLAVDPGFRNGCKLVALDQFGNVLGHDLIFLVGKTHRVAQAKESVKSLIDRFSLSVIAIGNGSGCRETEEFISTLLSEEYADREITYVIVNEAGASVYSISRTGREEFPLYDATLRSAISIGRRLQDPLSELVKIDPPSIGVGLYQHDVKAKHLHSSLDDVVESSVNFVGVDVNMASPALLKYVSGLNQLTARHVYEHRRQNGPFRNREELKSIQGIGQQTFTQAAGFLRISSGDQPLDATWIHPESYPVAEKLLAKIGAVPADVLEKEKLPELSRKLRELDSKAAAEELGGRRMDPQGPRFSVDAPRA